MKTNLLGHTHFLTFLCSPLPLSRIIFEVKLILTAWFIGGLLVFLFFGDLLLHSSSIFRLSSSSFCFLSRLRFFALAS